MDWINWLQDRYTIDKKARSKELEHKFLTYAKKIVSKNGKLTILDLGSGLGSSVINFIENLGDNQTWILVDKDSTIFENSKKYLSSYFKKNNWKILYPDLDLIDASQGSRMIKIKFVGSDIAQVHKLIDFTKIDMITSNALFDIIDEFSFDEFISKLKNYRIPLYLTLNYKLMRFNPISNLDRKYIESYENHMVREDNGKRRMGPLCDILMEKHLIQHSFTLYKDLSEWNLDSSTKRLLHFILEFMQEAIPKIIPKDNLVEFKEWIELKNAMLNEGSLKLNITHTDLFATPN